MRKSYKLFAQLPSLRHLLALVLMVICMPLAVAQSQRIFKGVVLDENGDPLPGATILVVGTKNQGVSTDGDGRFQLTLPKGKDAVVVSFVGYRSKTVKYKDAKSLSIKLEPDAGLLNEVVVTGMTTQDKRLFTGASDRISADKLKLDGVPDISRGLEGRSAGVSVQNVSGTFGTAPKIRVRGATSIHGSSKPLWVVDGVIQEDVVEVGADDLSSGDATTLISSAIAGLNADDIESFQILKDGSATSIYGAKAMAGVIVITTKKGRAGSSSFSYTGEFTMRLKPSYSDFNIMNSQDQMSVYQEMREKGWLNFSTMLRAPNQGVYGKMFNLMNTYDAERGQFLLENSPSAEARYLRDAELRNTDWFNELFNTSIMQNHSVSMSTGTDRSQSYVSVSAMLDPGWTKASKVNRYTLNVNNTFNLTPQLSLTTIGAGSFRQQRAPGTFAGEQDAINGTVTRKFDINPYSYAINASRTLDPRVAYQRNYAPFNIHDELENNYIDLEVFDLKLQSELKWRPIRGLTLAALGAVRYAGSGQKHQVTEFSNMALAHRAMQDATTLNSNSWLYTDPDKPNSLPITVLPEGGFYYKNTYKMLSYDFRATATYNTELAGKHIINSFAGIEFNSQDRSSDSFDGVGMRYAGGETSFWIYEYFKQLQDSNAGYYSIDNTLVRTHALFATATYSYKGKYTTTGTIRYEGSNRMGRSRQARWLPTWNVAAAWNVHEEGFFKKQNFLNHLSLKASYSLTADAGPQSNSLVRIQSYTPWRVHSSASEPGLRITDYENSELTYEKKNEFNFGIDLGMLNNRINLALDVYTRRNFDLVGSILTMSGERVGNSSKMKSHGFEASLSTKNIQTKGFSWTTDFIFGYATNEVTQLRSSSYMMRYISGSGFARVGYPVRGLYSIPFAGLDEDGHPTYMVNGKLVTKANYGSINFRQIEGLDFLKYEGATDPLFTGSLGNIFTIGDFKLNVFITYSGGNKLRLAEAFRRSYTDLDAMSRDFVNRWAKSGDEKHTDIPVIVSSLDTYKYGSFGTGYNAYNFSSARVANGDFVRLKEVSLTYTLPSKWLKGKVLKNASIKLQATNIALLYADKRLNGEDPEFFRSGGVAAPVPKQITATLRLGF